MGVLRRSGDSSDAHLAQYLADKDLDDEDNAGGPSRSLRT
jgi:hypothetical protein